MTVNDLAARRMQLEAQRDRLQRQARRMEDVAQRFEHLVKREGRNVHEFRDIVRQNAQLQTEIKVGAQNFHRNLSWTVPLTHEKLGFITEIAGITRAVGFIFSDFGSRPR